MVSTIHRQDIPSMLLILLLIFSITTVAVNGRCPPSRSSVEDRLRHAHIPGLAAIVVNATHILYEEAFGFHSPVSVEHPINVSESIFVLASLSKTFIALAVMQLVEKGAIDLDQDVNQYLPLSTRLSHPLFPNVTITVRHILSHGTGLGSNYEEDFLHAMPGDDFTTTNLTEVVLRYLTTNASWLEEPPGQVTYYSNVNAAWAALVVERVSGLSFEHYVRSNILNQLNIGGTEASYRLADFSSRREDLVEHYVYNISLLASYQQIAPQLNVIQVNQSY